MTRILATPGERAVLIRAGAVRLPGTLAWPAHPRGVVLFAHGSGSSRQSPRNRFVAERVRHAGLATLLFDLLTPEESADRENVFDIELLADRLVAASTWTAQQPETDGLPQGYFGASTGAGAALRAAAISPGPIGAVVSRGGRPDLAGDALPHVQAPTLLIVGGRDEPVIGLNREAQARLICPTRLMIIPGATHLFDEPGTLEQAAGWAAEWFAHHLGLTPATHGVHE
jgi:putative phosphoribosyl transferase